MFCTFREIDKKSELYLLLHLPDVMYHILSGIEVTGNVKYIDVNLHLSLEMSKNSIVLATTINYQLSLF